MKLKKGVKNIVYFIAMIVVATILILVMSFINEIKNNNSSYEEEQELTETTSGFNDTFIKKINDNNINNNYMFSPYSIELVLAMLRDGASDETYKELEKLVPERNIKLFSSKKRINVANGLFIKEGFEVEDSFKNIIVNRYNSLMVYDKFKTPAVINNWVKNATFGMIPKAIDTVSEDFVMAISNAVAIDVSWQKPFICANTKIEKFNAENNKTVNVAMMHNSYKDSAAYYKGDDATFVSIPYATYDKEGNISDSGVSLEFVGILPDGNVNDFINSYDFNNLSKDLRNMEKSSDKLVINVSLPRFKYNSDFDNLTSILKELGLKNTLGSSPNFSKMSDEKIFISEFIHKSFIDLNEAGTKAAAVTLVTFDKNAIETTKPKEVDVTFDKPFIYLIKDKNSKEILFFGVIYEPDEYKTITCEKED